jgi:hypothetical protein
MQGKKLVQTQNAMKTILKEMRPDDHLTIINFADEVVIWNEHGDILPATAKNVARYVTVSDARFLVVQTCQNGKNIQNDRKLYQTAINYTK